VRHRHIAVAGIDEVISGSASWCTQCKGTACYYGLLSYAHLGAMVDNNSDGKTDDIVDMEVSGPIKWESINPGRQLLTGSFHPVDDGNWFNFTYLDDDTGIA